MMMKDFKAGLSAGAGTKISQKNKMNMDPTFVPGSPGGPGGPGNPGGPLK